MAFNDVKTDKKQLSRHIEKAFPLGEEGGKTAGFDG